MNAPRDEFLSEEDLDIRNLSDAELSAWWLLWLRMAQATNDQDSGAYSHGVFDWDPAVPRPCTPAERHQRPTDPLPPPAPAR